MPITKTTTAGCSDILNNQYLITSRQATWLATLQAQQQLTFADRQQTDKATDTVPENKCHLQLAAREPVTITIKYTKHFNILLTAVFQFSKPKFC